MKNDDLIGARVVEVIEDENGNLKKIMVAKYTNSVFAAKTDIQEIKMYRISGASCICDEDFADGFLVYDNIRAHHDTYVRAKRLLRERDYRPDVR